MDPVINETLLRKPLNTSLILVHPTKYSSCVFYWWIKRERKSGGSCIITLEYGIHLVSGYNPNFGQISTIGSYGAEVYASIAATPFLHFYSTYYSVPVNNKIYALCNNQVYVYKLIWLLEDDYHHYGVHKILNQKHFHSFYIFFSQTSLSNILRDVKMIRRIIIS